jgi:zinc D-Ala-D-Ala carboxypeptidase
MPLSPKPSQKLHLPRASLQTSRAASQLSANFSLAQLTHSDTALKHGIANTVEPAHLINLRRLAAALEQVQRLLQHPLTINSAYRNREVNRLVGGVPASRHALGLAVDFVCPAFGTPLEVARAIAASPLGFDQLIHEYGRWVHLGLAVEGETERRQLLTIRTAAEGYLDGLVDTTVV